MGKTKKKKIYILQKELPDCEVGKRFVEMADGINYITHSNYTLDGHGLKYNKKFVENNPDWFRLKVQ